MQASVAAWCERRWVVLLSLVGCVIPVTSHAHPGDLTAVGFFAGLLHPWTGMDHMAAMLAVGLWASRSRERAIVSLLIATAAGILMGVVFGSYPHLFTLGERITALSAVVLGILAAGAGQMRVPFAAALVLVFGAFHGYVHAVETPRQLSQHAFTGGFIGSMLLLQVIGVVLARLAHCSFVRTAAVGCVIAGCLSLAAI